MLDPIKTLPRFEPNLLPKWRLRLENDLLKNLTNVDILKTIKKEISDFRKKSTSKNLLRSLFIHFYHIKY